MASPILFGANNLSTGLQNGVLNANGSIDTMNGPVNYISYGNFANNATTGWSLGTTGTLTNGIPTGTPTFGSGTTALTLSTVASSQSLSGYALSLAASTATTVGNMLATQAYTIATADQAKVLTFKCYYSVPVGVANCNFSGTSSNSFGIAFWDPSTSTWLSSTANFGMTQSTGTGYVTCTVQTGSTTTSIQAVIYAANATAGAATLYFTDFFLGPQTAPIGAVVTDWTTNLALTPSASFGTVTSATYETCRIGDSLYVRGTFNAGTTTAAIASITLPSGLSINTSKLPSSAVGTEVGRFAATNTATTAFTASGGDMPIFYDGSTTTAVFLAQQTSGGALVKNNANNIVGTGNGCTFEFSVPIQGWSSNLSLSSDSDTRVVSFSVNTSSTAGSTSTPLIFSVVSDDSHGAYNASTGQYKIPVSGRYSFQSTQYYGAGSATTNIYKNGGSVAQGSIATGGSNAGVTVYTGNFVAGDLVDTRPNGSVTASGSNIINVFSGFRLSGPSVIAATESVNASYYLSANSSAAHIPFDTKIFDSHNAATTGASFVYTAPVSGTYSLSVVALSASGSNNLQLFKNGSMYSLLGTQVSTTAVGSGTLQFKMNAGDTCYINNPGSITITGAAPASNGAVMSIMRVGN